MLKQHEFYVYYEENRVYARMGEHKPVIAEIMETPQAAHDKVQSVVNPKGLPSAQIGPKGFNEDSFQKAISDNCRAYVEAAYAKGTTKD